ncbi:MAG: metallophosphoesterase [Clostridiales bacterium]|nr:metallophosphoesterase [Clostridiales bacterium]
MRERNSGRFYVTGDCHGDFNKIDFFCRWRQTCRKDFMIILGDSGINYWADSSDRKTKCMISKLPISFFVVHGNHEARASELDFYQEKSWHGGIVYYEEKFPNILFAKDGEIYDFNGKKGIVIGGAYSVDKNFRIDAGLPWYENEQPSAEIKAYVETKLKDCGWMVDFVFSHTCPSSLEPQDMYLEYIDQSKVDKTTEEWLERIHSRLQYKMWYFGHFHENRQYAHAVMLFEEIRELGADSFLQRVGRPRYKVGDRVLFYPDERRDYAGTIVVVDAYGTMADSTQVHYDIKTQDGFLYKHVPETLVEKIEDIKAGRDVVD